LCCGFIIVLVVVLVLEERFAQPNVSEVDIGYALGPSDGKGKTRADISRTRTTTRTRTRTIMMGLAEHPLAPRFQLQALLNHRDGSNKRLRRISLALQKIHHRSSFQLFV
jgi:hypothetical protein